MLLHADVSKTRSLRKNLKEGPASGGKRSLDASWSSWLRENLARDCNPDELFKILVDNGFDVATVTRAMGGHRPSRALSEITNPLATRDLPVDRAIYEESFDCPLARGERGAVAVPVERVQLFTVADFMSQDECRRLIDLIDTRLRPSTVTTADTPTDFRTSKTCDLSLLPDPFVTEIDARIAERLGVRLAYSESIQAQRYAVGEQFKAHTDYFEPGTKEFEEHARDRGQRTWTFMVYLNDTPAGGGTRFVELGHTFSPKAGLAVVWNNLLRDGMPNRATLHWGMPVEAGQKYIITKWFRDKGAGGMLI